MNERVILDLEYCTPVKNIETKRIAISGHDPEQPVSFCRSGYSYKDQFFWSRSRIGLITQSDG